jgi:hypothetical protein
MIWVQIMAAKVRFYFIFVAQKSAALHPSLFCRFPSGVRRSPTLLRKVIDNQRVMADFGKEYVCLSGKTVKDVAPEA